MDREAICRKVDSILAGSPVVLHSVREALADGALITEVCRCPLEPDCLLIRQTTEGPDGQWREQAVFLGKGTLAQLLPVITRSDWAASSGGSDAKPR